MAEREGGEEPVIGCDTAFRKRLSPPDWRRNGMERKRYLPAKKGRRSEIVAQLVGRAGWMDGVSWLILPFSSEET